MSSNQHIPHGLHLSCSSQKKHVKLLFCIEYRKLNSVTVKYSYPISGMEACIELLGQTKVFSTLDAYYGNRKIQFNAEDGHKTTFTCHADAYQCIRMPFGLIIAPATLQSALNLILSKLNWKTCLIYLDDGIIYYNAIEKQIHYVDEVLSTLKTVGVTLNI